MLQAPATCQHFPLGDLISYNTLFPVFCGPQTHPNYRPAQRTPRYKEPQYDLARGCHYVYSRTCVTLEHPRAHLLRVGFRGYFGNIPKTYARPSEMTSTGLDRCLVYVPRRFPRDAHPGHRLRRRPARARERRLRGPRGPKNYRQATEPRLGPPHVSPQRGRERRQAYRRPRAARGTSSWAAGRRRQASS